MDQVIKDLYDVVAQRRQNPQEGSYTCYLFEKGTDKILKKCGEECAEAIIAAKNNDHDELCNEICDLIYHFVVLMISQGIPLNDVQEILKQRSLKIGNLKKMHTTDRNS